MRPDRRIVAPARRVLNVALNACPSPGKVAAGVEEPATAAAAALPLTLKRLDRLKLPGQMRGSRIAAAELGSKRAAGIGVGRGKTDKQSENTPRKLRRNIPNR